jgi:hypothetical protein
VLRYFEQTIEACPVAGSICIKGKSGSRSTREILTGRG